MRLEIWEKNWRGDERTETSLRSVTIDAENGQQRGSVFASTAVQLLRGGSEQPKDGIRQSWGFAGKYSKEKEEQGWLWWWTTSKEEARIRARWKTEKGGRISRRWMALEGVKQHLEKWLKLGCHQTTVQWSRELGGSTAVPSKFWMEVIFFPEVYKKPNCKLKDIFRHKILENSPPKPPFLRKLLEDTL